MNGERIKHYRKMAGLSQKELAAQCNIEIGKLQLIERGAKDADYNLLKKLSYVLKIDPNKLDPDFVDTYHNGAGCTDQTAGEAISHINYRGNKRDQRIEDINECMKVLKIVCNMKNLQILGRVSFKDKITGKEYH